MGRCAKLGGCCSFLQLSSRRRSSPWLAAGGGVHPGELHPGEGLRVLLLDIEVDISGESWLAWEVVGGGRAEESEERQEDCNHHTQQSGH